ncbi:MAG TPA: hypothetical protein VF510_02155 [Ktedonobacterales bacterium]
MGRKFYLLWLLSAALGALGAAADVSWHFSRVFDEFSPPHNVATTGFILNIGLLYWALVRHRDRLSDGERVGLMLNALGTALFLVGIPLDFTWHQIFGIDITTWSPTHLLLFYSACVSEVGVLKAWLSSPEGHGRGSWAISFFICFFFLSAALFPLGQQEYAAVALDSLNRTGKAPWFVAPDLWALAGPQAVKLAKGGAPDWLYLVYQPAVAALVLTVVSMLLRFSAVRQYKAQASAVSRWYSYLPATCLVLALLAFRIAGRTVFSIIGMPVATIPWWLIPLALVLDIAFLFESVLTTLTRVLPAAVRAQPQAVVGALGAIVGTLAYYGSMLVLRNYHVLMPAAPLALLPVALVTAAAGAVAGALLAGWLLEQAEAQTVRGATTTRAAKPALAGARNVK